MAENFPGGTIIETPAPSPDLIDEQTALDQLNAAAEQLNAADSYGRYSAEQDTAAEAPALPSRGDIHKFTGPNGQEAVHVVTGIGDNGHVKTKLFNDSAAAEAHSNELKAQFAAFDNQFTAPSAPPVPGGRASRREEIAANGFSVGEIAEKIATKEATLVPLAELPTVKQVLDSAQDKKEQTSEQPTNEDGKTVEKSEQAENELSPEGIGKELIAEQKKLGLFGKIRSGIDKANGFLSTKYSAVLGKLADSAEKQKIQPGESVTDYNERSRKSALRRGVGVVALAATYMGAQTFLRIDAISTGAGFNAAGFTPPAPDEALSEAPQAAPQTPSAAAESPLALRNGGGAFANTAPTEPRTDRVAHSDSATFTEPRLERSSLAETSPNTTVKPANESLAFEKANEAGMYDKHIVVMGPSSQEIVTQQEWHINREGNDLGTALVAGEYDGDAPAGFDDLVNNRWADSPTQFASVLTGMGLAEGFGDNAADINALAEQLANNPDLYDSYREQVEAIFNKSSTSISEAQITNPYSSEYMVEVDGKLVLARDDYVDQGGTKMIITFENSAGELQTIELRKDCGGQRIVEQVPAPTPEAPVVVPFVPEVSAPTPDTPQEYTSTTPTPEPAPQPLHPNTPAFHEPTPDNPVEPVKPIKPEEPTTPTPETEEPDWSKPRDLAKWQRPGTDSTTDSDIGEIAHAEADANAIPADSVEQTVAPNEDTSTGEDIHNEDGEQSGVGAIGTDDQTLDIPADNGGGTIEDASAPESVQQDSAPAQTPTNDGTLATDPFSDPNIIAQLAEEEARKAAGN